MKRLFPLLLLVLAASAAVAEEPDHEVHEALRKLKTTMSDALNKRDVNTIVANVTPDITFTTMNGDAVHGREQIRAYFDKMMNAPGHVVKSVTTSFEADALTTLYGGDTGIAYGSSSDHYELTNGQKFDIRGRWSCTMVKEGDRWLIANFHYSANIFDNPILNKMRSLTTTAAIVAALVALIAGIVIGRLSARRKAA